MFGCIGFPILSWDRSLGGSGVEDRELQAESLLLRLELSDESSGLLFPLDTEFEGNSEESDTSMGPPPGNPSSNVLLQPEMYTV